MLPPSPKYFMYMLNDFWLISNYLVHFSNVIFLYNGGILAQYTENTHGFHAVFFHLVHIIYAQSTEFKRNGFCNEYVFMSFFHFFIVLQFVFRFNFFSSFILPFLCRCLSYRSLLNMYTILSVSIASNFEYDFAIQLSWAMWKAVAAYQNASTL